MIVGRRRRVNWAETAMGAGQRPVRAAARLRRLPPAVNALTQPAISDAAIDHITGLLIDTLSASPVVERVWLFGSRARGDARPRSDIDIAVTAPQASLRDWERLLGQVEALPTLLKIDCVRFDALAEGDSLRAAVERDGRLLFDRRHAGGGT